MDEPVPLPPRRPDLRSRIKAYLNMIFFFLNTHNFYLKITNMDIVPSPRRRGKGEVISLLVSPSLSMV